MSYHQPYAACGNRSARSRGFSGARRTNSVVMRAVKGGYEVGIMPIFYDTSSTRRDRNKKPALLEVQIFKTEKAARKYMDSLLAGGL